MLAPYRDKMTEHSRNRELNRKAGILSRKIDLDSDEQLARLVGYIGEMYKKENSFEGSLSEIAAGARMSISKADRKLSYLASKGVVEYGPAKFVALTALGERYMSVLSIQRKKEILANRYGIEVLQDGYDIYVRRVGQAPGGA